MTNINLLLADDHPVVRSGLKLILETQSDFTIIGEAENGREALAHVEQQCPDVIIMDITMPDLNGIEAARQIREICLETRIIILTMHSSSRLVIRALQAGALGYLLKGTANNEMITAIRTVYGNHRYLSAAVLKQLSPKTLDQLEALEIDDPLGMLSPREREVLQLVVEGKSSAEIAETLYLSTKTVETYRHRLMQKLNINDIPGLVKFAIQYGLTSLE